MNSIVIPIYNREGSLRRAVESVLAQSYDNFELILVDDGSTDGSLHVCEQLKSENPERKIIVKSIEHGGVSRARNAGIELAQGEWISFLDSDDEIAPCFLEHTLAATKERKIDWVYCSRIAITEDPHTKTELHTYRENRFFSEEDKDELFADVLYRHWDNNLYSSCMGIFRRELLNKHGIRFAEDVDDGEDILFNIEVAHYTRGFFYLAEPLYMYHVRQHSADLAPVEHLIDRVPLILSAYERTRKRLGIEITQEYLWRAMNFIDNPFRSYLCLDNCPLTKEGRARAYQRYEKMLQQEPLPRFWEALSFRRFVKSVEPKKALVLWCLRNKHYELLRFLYRFRSNTFKVSWVARDKR